MTKQFLGMAILSLIVVIGVIMHLNMNGFRKVSQFSELIAFNKPGCVTNEDCEGNALCLNKGLLGKGWCGGFPSDFVECPNIAGKSDTNANPSSFYQCARGVNIVGDEGGVPGTYDFGSHMCDSNVKVENLQQYCICPDDMECAQGCGIASNGYCRPKIIQNDVCPERNALDYFCCTGTGFNKCNNGLCNNFDCNRCRDIAECTGVGPTNTYCPKNGDPNCFAPWNPDGGCFNEKWKEIKDVTSGTEYEEIGPYSSMDTLEAFLTKFPQFEYRMPCMGQISGKNPDCKSTSNKESFGDTHCLSSNSCCFDQKPETEDKGCQLPQSACGGNALGSNEENYSYQFNDNCTDLPYQYKTAVCSEGAIKKGKSLIQLDEDIWVCCTVTDAGTEWEDCMSDDKDKYTDLEWPKWGCYGLKGFTPGDKDFEPEKWCPPCRPPGMEQYTGYNK